MLKYNGNLLLIVVCCLCWYVLLLGTPSSISHYCILWSSVNGECLQRDFENYNVCVIADGVVIPFSHLIPYQGYCLPHVLKCMCGEKKAWYHYL